MDDETPDLPDLGFMFGPEAEEQAESTLTLMHFLKNAYTTAQMVGFTQGEAWALTMKLYSQVIGGAKTE